MSVLRGSGHPINLRRTRDSALVLLEICLDTSATPIMLQDGLELIEAQLIPRNFLVDSAAICNKLLSWNEASTSIGCEQNCPQNCRTVSNSCPTFLSYIGLCDVILSCVGLSYENQNSLFMDAKASLRRPSVFACRAQKACSNSIRRVPHRTVYVRQCQ